MARRRLKPYQQGQLDGLCGVYAIINAVRLALGDRGGQFAQEDWQELFSALLVEADEIVGTATIVSGGIDTRPLTKLLKLAVCHMADEHEVTLTVSRPFTSRERTSLHEVVERLAELTREPHAAVLLSLAGHMDHWSVLRKVGRRSLKLFDSDGHVLVRIAECRMSYERRRNGAREHIIHPPAVFRVVVSLG